MAATKTLSEWIAYAHSLGLAISNMCQLPNGDWRVCMVVFGATPALARDREHTDYADRQTPEECFAAIFASDKHRAAWEPKAREAVAAMADPTKCCATLILADRPAVDAARSAFLKDKRSKVGDVAHASIVQGYQSRVSSPAEYIAAEAARERRRRVLGE